MPESRLSQAARHQADRIAVQMEKKRVGIALFEDIEVLDFCGPFEVFSATRSNEKGRRLDVVVAPRGWGTRRELKNPVLLDWLRTRAAEAQTVTAVCTGSRSLGFADLLDRLHATTHWRSLDWMRDSFPSVTVEYNKHFVVDGRVITSAGISAGIDMALKVVERYFGEGIARATARHMEFAYAETDVRRSQL